MWLTNLRLPTIQGSWSLHIRDGKIAALIPAGAAPPYALHFDQDLIFPGLINSHEHLDFNLFPALGNNRYTNYRTWGWDIHTRNTDQINKILKIPHALRTSWGIYKNLLNGFTTVVNHGAYLHTPDAPITIFQECHNLHSVGFERHWRWKLNKPAKTSWPFVLHVGEGTDTIARDEISQLIRWNLFKRPLIGIHGVGMTEKQAENFQALVWCPASNYFLLNQTAPIDQLKKITPIVFGTDSTLTAPWDCWSQIRLAREQAVATDLELFEMLTSNPASVWGLTDRGSLSEGLLADLVVARPQTHTQAIDDFYSLTPDDILLVIRHGKVVLFDPTLRSTLTDSGLVNDEFDQACPNGKYVPGNIHRLMEDIRQYYPEVQFPFN